MRNRMNIDISIYVKRGMLLSFVLIPFIAFAEFEQTTDTKTTDSDFKGGYTKQELDQMAMGKEQKAIMDKFMKGRYSSATGQGSRYSNILEYHDSNFDGITEHDDANNAAESSGDLVGLGKKGLSGNARRRAMIVERINSSGNCEPTENDNKLLKDNNFTMITGAVKGKSWDTRQLVNEVLESGWNRYLEVKDGVLTPLSTLTADAEKLKAGEMQALFNRQKEAQGYVAKLDKDGKDTGKYYMKCPNVSAIVIDKGSAHGADIGAGHRVYTLNEKTFKAGKGANGPFGTTIAGPAGGDAEGAAVSVAKDYVNAVKSDSATTAIPPEVIAAMQAQGMNIKASADGKTVTITNSNGTETREVGASIDDLKSEFAWLEAQKKHRLNETWKTLRAERFIAGDGYDPSKVSSEIGSLLAQHADKSEAERDKIVADKVAEQNLYDSTAVCLRVSGGRLGSPEPCPKTPFKAADRNSLIAQKDMKDICGDGTTADPNCFLPATSKDLRSSELSAHYQSGAVVADYTNAAINAAKQMAARDPAEAAKTEASKRRLAERVQSCMARGKWCEQVDLSSYRSLVDKPGDLQAALNRDDRLKNRGITVEDVKAGTAYLETKGDPGNAFKDTREFVAAQMETAMEGPLSKFLDTVRSADFSEATDAKTGTNNFAVVKQQWEKNMQMAKDVRKYAEDAYNECVRVGGKDCQKQFDDNNFNVNKMNTVELFGRNTSRDGSTTGVEATQLVNEDPGLGGGQSFSSPSSMGLRERAPSSAPLPARGSAPASVSSPFSLN